MFRSDYELLTGITNLFILIVSLYSFIRLKRINYNKYWLSFYMFLIVGSLLGFIIHSFNINDKIVNIPTGSFAPKKESVPEVKVEEKKIF